MRRGAHVCVPHFESSHQPAALRMSTPSASSTTAASVTPHPSRGARPSSRPSARRRRATQASRENRPPGRRRRRRGRDPSSAEGGGVDEVRIVEHRALLRRHRLVGAALQVRERLCRGVDEGQHVAAEEEGLSRSPRGLVRAERRAVEGRSALRAEVLHDHPIALRRDAHVAPGRVRIVEREVRLVGAAEHVQPARLAERQGLAGVGSLDHDDARLGRLPARGEPVRHQRQRHPARGRGRSRRGGRAAPPTAPATRVRCARGRRCGSRAVTAARAAPCRAACRSCCPRR